MLNLFFCFNKKIYVFIKRSLRKLNIGESNLAFFVELPQSVTIDFNLLEIEVLIFFEWIS